MNIISLCQCQTGKRMNIQKNEVQIYVVMDAEKEKERGVGWEGGGVGVLDSKSINIKQFEGRKRFKAIIYFTKMDLLQ